VILILSESDRKSLCARSFDRDIGIRDRGSRRRTRGDGAVEPESDLVDRKQSFVQTLAEAFGQFDNLFVAQQAHDVPQAVVHSPAVITGLKVLLDTKSEVRGEIALQVIRQLPADLIAIDFYYSRFARHEYHRSMGCRDAQ
jgi:hypothetical protein